MINRSTQARCQSFVAVSLKIAFTLSARADLSWFETENPLFPQPIRLSEVIAWSDACLAIDTEEWSDVAQLHRAYVEQWRIPAETLVGDTAADARFFDGLAVRLGADRSTCLAAMRAWRAVPTRLANDEKSAEKLRREVLALSSASLESVALEGKTDEEKLDAQRRAQALAAELCQRMSSAVGRGNTRPADELIVLLRAVLPLRPQLIEILGQSAADRLQRTIVLRADIARPVFLGAKTKALLDFADRLTPEERAGIHAAFSRADALIDAIVLEGRGVANPTERGDAAEMSAWTSTWLTSKRAAEKLIASDFERVIGAERLQALRMLEVDGVSMLPPTDDGNTRADAALSLFVDPARFDALAIVLGGSKGSRPWHPLGKIPLGEEEIQAMRIPVPIPREHLRAVIEPSRLDASKLDVLESIHIGHVERMRALGKADDSLKRSFIEAVLREDERTFCEVVAAFGEESVPAARVALVQLSRAELGSGFRPLGANLDGCWIQAPDRADGSIALLSLDIPQDCVVSMMDGDQELLRTVLEPRAAEWTRLLIDEARAAATDAERAASIGRDRSSEDTAALRSTRLVRVGRDAARARAALERIHRLVEALRAAGPSGDRAALSVLLATVDTVFDRSEAAQRLVSLLSQVKSSAHADDSTEVSSAVRAEAILRLVDMYGGVDDGSLGKLHRLIDVTRKIEVLAARADDENARARACEASLAAIKDSHTIAYRREAGWAEAWRVLRAASVPAAKQAFLP